MFPKNCVNLKVHFFVFLLAFLCLFGYVYPPPAVVQAGCTPVQKIVHADFGGAHIWPKFQKMRKKMPKTSVKGENQA